MEPSKKTVMIVDDSRTISRTAELFLKQAGYDVVIVSDGFYALSSVLDVRPDLLFLDVMMPRLDGFTTCLMIKSNEDFKDLPIVMLTSKDGAIDRAKGQLMGCNDYFTKPFSKDALLECVEKNLNLSANNT